MDAAGNEYSAPKDISVQLQTAGYAGQAKYRAPQTATLEAALTAF